MFASIIIYTSNAYYTFSLCSAVNAALIQFRYVICNGSGDEMRNMHETEGS